MTSEHILKGRCPLSPEADEPQRVDRLETRSGTVGMNLRS